MYFDELDFESDEQEFGLRGVNSKKICSYLGRDLLKSVLKVRNAWVRVEWVERDEQLSVIYVKVEDKGKERDQSAERGSVYDEEQSAENRALGNTTRGSMKGWEDVVTFNTKEARW